MKDRRVMLLFTFFVVGFVFITVNLIKIQIIDWKKYSVQVQDMSTRIIVNQAKRGNIYDRDGKLMAWNQKIFQIENLHSELSQESVKKIKEILSKENLLLDNVIDKLNFQKKITLEINSTTAKKLSALNDLIVTEKYIRKYAHESLYHFIGYVDREGNPRTGLEKDWNDKLKGKNGYQLVNITPSGKIKNILEEIPAISGNNIYTTIDLSIQEKVYDILSEQKNPAAVVVSDPNTGEILAMVSYPSPDANQFSKGLTNLELSRILNDKNSPLINRTISSKYFPGSIIKPFIALSALELGISPDATVNSTGKYYLKDSRGNVIGSYDDWNILGHGITNMIKSLRVSANYYYYWLGETLGIDIMKEKSIFYKFDDLTDIDVPGEVKGVFPSMDWKMQNLGEMWYPGESLLAYIGQGYVTNTPIEILRFYNILATKGNYYQFHVYKDEEDQFKKVVNSFENTLRDSYQISEDYLAIVREGMIEAASYAGDSKDGGTAYKYFGDFRYKIAAKTGTAEVYGGKKPHAWFAGYFPVDNPKYSIVVLVENGGFGSDIATPIGRKILDFVAVKIGK